MQQSKLKRYMSNKNIRENNILKMMKKILNKNYFYIDNNKKRIKCNQK